MLTVIIKDEMWGNVPLLHIIDEEYLNKDVPVVIFLHGFTSAKEHNLHYAYNIAKKGIRVLLPDAHLHGVRDEQLDEVQLGLRFWEIVLTSIEEVDFLRGELEKRKLVATPKIGIGGTSMGGITSLGCLAIYDWIHTAAVMMGTPGFVELAKAQIAQFERQGFELPISEEEKLSLFDNLSIFDLTKNRSSLNKRPVFFWHGKNDTVVPHDQTFNFYEAVKNDYLDVPERILFISDDEAGHAVTRSGLLSAVDWFASYLDE